MKPEFIEKWLSEPHGNEWELYQDCFKRKQNYDATEHRWANSPAGNRKIRNANEVKNLKTLNAFESLASTRAKSEQRRAMLKKHQYGEDHCCVDCGGHPYCFSDCAYAALVKEEKQ